MHSRRAAIAAVLLLAGLAGNTSRARADTSFNGLVFADFSDKRNQDKATGAKSSDSGVGADVKRFYFTVTHEFDSIWSAQFQSDIGDQGARRYDVFVKKAYIRARLDPLLSLQLGSANTPWVAYVDEVFGYRWIENTLVDRLGYGSSADWGLHVNGSTENKVFGYAVAALNGRGYSNPTRSKSVDFEGRVSVQPVAGLYLAAGGYSGRRGLDSFSAPARHTATRTDLLAAYNSQYFRLGGEWFQGRNLNNVTTVATDKSDGYSLYGTINFTSAIGLFGRYDGAKPSKDLKPSLKDSLFHVGLQWRANKALAAALVYKYEQVENGSISTPNGTIGSASPTHKGDYKEFGLWTVYAF
jgi:hypothetical protein